MAFRYSCGRTFNEVKQWLHISDQDADKIWRTCIEQEGYTETALCFVAAKCEDKLSNYIGDNRFATVFINEVHKNAYKPGDQRWDNRRRSYEH